MTFPGPVVSTPETRIAWAEKLLRVFGDVRSGEGQLTLLLTLNLFLLLAAYYVLKTVREPLILTTGGAEMKSYAAAAQALTLTGFVPLYSWFAGRAGRRALLTGVLLFFTIQVEAFALGLHLDAPMLGFLFYVWVGIFSLASIAQFWSYANDVFNRETGERLFPIMALGATVGSPVGAWLARALFESGTTTVDMLHLAALMLLLHLGLYSAIERRLSGLDRAGQPTPAPPRRGGGFALLWSNPFLCWVAIFLLCLNVINTVGEYIVSRSVLEAATRAIQEGRATDVGTFVGSFYGEYFFWVNVLAVALQALLASRIVRWAGTAGAVLTLPVVALGAYGLIAAGAGFGAIRWMKTVENATDYSIMNTGRQLLWLPTSRDEKYKAKQAMDTFFVRAGDMIAAGVVLAGTSWVALSVRQFALINLALVIGWLLLGYLVARSYRQLCAECP
ncbi:MAG: NTP/NDP exchange transporter [Vicinamibacterales bacterium]